jgi:hypothetical protein
MVTNNSWNSQDPAQVAKGGTGNATATAYAVQCGGTTTTTPFQSVASVGTSGQVLTSNGAGALPTFETNAGGDVTGTPPSTEHALARYADTSGLLIENSTVLVSDNGEMTNASQPAFLAFNSVTDTNQTGAGTVATVIFDTEVFDQNADYNNATGVFTAPVTGRYFLQSSIEIGSLTAAMTSGQFRITTSNREFAYTFNPGGTRTSGNARSAQLSCLADMDAADTSIIRILVQNGVGDTASVVGAASPITYYSGNLVC